MYSEFCFLASQILNEVVSRESNLNCYIIASLVTLQLIFESRNEAAGTDFQRISLAFAAFKCYAIYSALEVDDCEVAILEFSAFYNFQTGIVFSQLLELSHNVVIGYNWFCMLCIQVLVFTKLNFRTLNECSCKCRAVLFRERFILNFRLGYRYKLFILKCLFQCAVEYDFLSFAFNSFLAQVHFQYLARCLALAETLQSDLVCET